MQILPNSLLFGFSCFGVEIDEIRLLEQTILIFIVFFECPGDVDILLGAGIAGAIGHKFGALFFIHLCLSGVFLEDFFENEFGILCHLKLAVE